MSYDVYWVKNRAEKIADFEHPTLEGLRWSHDSGSAIYDTPQTTILGRAGGTT